MTIPEVQSGSEKQVDGEFGKLLSSQGILLNITEIKAESGQEFILTKQSQLTAIEKIKSNLSVGDVGKDTGILSFNYVGVDKNKIQAILNRACWTLVIVLKMLGLNSQYLHRFKATSPVWKYLDKFASIQIKTNT